ncbi:MAG: Crp/Fnr family transcriptional regulator [Candidatus Acidiferrales bacterium]
MRSHENCVVFSRVIREHLSALSGFTSERSYQRGETIYLMDDPADELYWISQGRVKIIRLSADGQQKILDIYQAGDFFGELCICGGMRRSEQAVALEALVTTSFQVKGLMKLLRRSPDMVLELVQLLCARLRESHDQIAALAFENIPRRLAREILRLGRNNQAQPGADDSRIALQLTHEELAQLVGTSREIVTTVMNQFRQRGLLDYTRRNILVNRPRVEAFLTNNQ